MEKNSYLTLDRIESTKAVLQDDAGQNHLFSKETLPAGAKEGDVFLLQENNRLTFCPTETENRRAAAADLLNSLWKE